MKAKDLKFPLIINWYGCIYEVEEDSDYCLNWTNFNTGSTSRNSVTRHGIEDALKYHPEKVKIIHMPKDNRNTQFKVDVKVNADKLKETLELAKELEETLKRVKALLA